MLIFTCAPEGMCLCMSIYVYVHVMIKTHRKTQTHVLNTETRTLSFSEWVHVWFILFVLLSENITFFHEQKQQTFLKLCKCPVSPSNSVILQFVIRKLLFSLLSYLYSLYLTERQTVQFLLFWEVGWGDWKRVYTINVFIHFCVFFRNEKKNVRVCVCLCLCAHAIVYVAFRDRGRSGLVNVHTKQQALEWFSRFCFHN